MPNPYIQVYESNRNLSSDYLSSAILALQTLVQAREKLGYKQKKSQFFAWRGDILSGLKLFFDPKITAKNMTIVSDMLEQLIILKDKNREIHEDLTDFMNILVLKKDQLSEKGESLALINHILMDISKISFSNRPSSIIQPSAEEVLSKSEPEYPEYLSETESESSYPKYLSETEEEITEEKERIKEGQPYSYDQRWDVELKAILKKKNLPANLFKQKNKIDFKEHISEHIKWAFNHIYKMPYPGEAHHNQEEHGEIRRYHHGIQHVTRAALYIPVFANLYRRYDDGDAQSLTEDHIKLLQLAALFHDSAREDENVDRWDHESAIFLYMYLRRILNIDNKLAKELAEAVANKDPNKEGYFSINETEKDAISWRWEKQRTKKNIFQKIMHDADCLDIIRARDSFEAEHLDFYKQYYTNPLAIEEMAHLITEARSLIEIQGDSRNRTKTNIKAQYEHKDAYYASIKSIDPKQHPIIATLHCELIPSPALKKIELVDRTPYDPKVGCTLTNILAAIRAGKIFARGIGAPSAISNKPLKSGMQESLAATEIRKGMRRVGVATSTSKGNALEKAGNPLRSVSMLGYGSGVFTNAGFLIMDPKLEDISEVYSIDSGTGRGKKTHLKDKKAEISSSEKEEQLFALNHKLKMGGSTVKFNNIGHVSNHVEILYRITDYSAIYFSSDPNLYNDDAYRSPEATHPYSPILQAIYLRNEYKLASHSKVELPLIEYSGLHNTARIVPPEEITAEEIKKMWVAMCSKYMKDCLANIYEEDIFTMPINDIKTLSMYKCMANKFAKENAPADANYDNFFYKGFQNEISVAIEMERQRLIKEQENSVQESIKSGDLDVFTDEAFLNLKRNPNLAFSLIDKIKDAFQTMKSSTNLGIKLLDDFIDYSRVERGVLDSLPNKKDEIFKKNSYAKELCFKTNAIRMYTLAKQLNLTEDAKYVQGEMKNVVMQAIAEQQKKISHKAGNLVSITPYDYDSLKDLINFSFSFGLYPDDKIVKGHIESIVSQYFKCFAEDFQIKPLKRISNYSRFILYLNSTGLLTPEVRAFTIEILSKNENLIESRKFDSDDLRIFFDTAKALTMPCSCEEIAFKWLASRKDFWLSRDTMYELNSVIDVVPLENLSLFEKVVKLIPINSNPKLLGASEIDIYLWIDLVTNLELKAKNKEFNSIQLSMLQSRADELCAQKIQLVALDKYSFIELIVDAKAFLGKNVAITIPKIVVEAIKDMSSSVDLEKLDKNHLESLKFICKNLPEEQQVKLADLKQKLNNLEIAPRLLLP